MYSINVAFGISNKNLVNWCFLGAVNMGNPITLITTKNMLPIDYGIGSRILIPYDMSWIDYD